MFCFQFCRINASRIQNPIFGATNVHAILLNNCSLHTIQLRPGVLQPRWPLVICRLSRHIIFYVSLERNTAAHSRAKCQSKCFGNIYPWVYSLLAPHIHTGGLFALSFICVSLVNNMCVWVAIHCMWVGKHQQQITISIKIRNCSIVSSYILLNKLCCMFSTTLLRFQYVWGPCLTT